MLFIDSKMPPSTNSQLRRLVTKISVFKREIGERLPQRRKVFFDSPGLLEQSQHWGGLVIWTIAAGTTAGLLWAVFGRVDQTVVANGTLQPVSGKMIVSSTTAGIVRELFVADGDIVAKGETLMVVESEGTKARLQSTLKQLALYQYENQLFNLLLDQQGRFDLSSLPEAPDLIRNEDRTRSVQLTVQETSARLELLRTRLASPKRTLALGLGARGFASSCVRKRWYCEV